MIVRMSTSWEGSSSLKSRMATPNRWQRTFSAGEAKVRTACDAGSWKAAARQWLAPGWLVVVVALSACRQENPSPPAAQSPAVPVRVLTVEPQRRLATEEAVGTIRAKLRATVEAKVSGRIERLGVVPGQTVKAGELLAQLDAREIQARLDQAFAAREQLARDTERLRRLLKDNAVSRQEFENVESRHRVAVAAVTEAETMLGYARITAPFAGVVTRKLADVGDLAAPGKPLVELEDPTALRLEAEVPEALITRVRLGDKLPVRMAAAETGLEGVVSEVAPVADPVSRTFLVKLDLPPAAALRSGQFARVAVPVGESAVLRVPAGAVLQRGQMELVFIETHRIAHLRLVKTGKRLDGEVELVSGVEAGERVVTDGAAALRDGQAVEVR
jgi:RND family efflux transporter MFP subunit